MQPYGCNVLLADSLFVAGCGKCGNLGFELPCDLSHAIRIAHGPGRAEVGAFFVFLRARVLHDRTSERIKAVLGDLATL